MLKPNPKVHRQHSHNSPLIPRRNDYEPIARVTIQRQQRVSEQSPTKSSNERLNTAFTFTSESNSTHLTRPQQISLGPSGKSSQIETSPAINRPITLDLTRALSNSNTNSSGNMLVGVGGVGGGGLSSSSSSNLGAYSTLR